MEKKFKLYNYLYSILFVIYLYASICLLYTHEIDYKLKLPFTVFSIVQTFLFLTILDLTYHVNNDLSLKDYSQLNSTQHRLNQLLYIHLTSSFLLSSMVTYFFLSNFIFIHSWWYSYIIIFLLFTGFSSIFIYFNTKKN